MVTTTRAWSRVMRRIRLIHQGQSGRSWNIGRAFDIIKMTACVVSSRAHPRSVPSIETDGQWAVMLARRS